MKKKLLDIIFRGMISPSTVFFLKYNLLYNLLMCDYLICTYANSFTVFWGAEGQLASNPSEGHMEPSVSPHVLLLSEGFSLNPSQITLLPSHPSQHQPPSSNQNNSSALKFLSSFEVSWDMNSLLGKTSC